MSEETRPEDGDWDELLDRYWADEVTAAERAAVGAWVAENPERRQVVERMREARARQVTQGISAAGAMVDALRARIREERTVVPSRVTPSVVRWLPMLAAAVIGFVLLAIWHYGTRHTYREFTTVDGQRTNITLPDGTRVVLGPDSHLRMLAARTLELDGEGYFAVVHDVQHPFTIFSHNIAITDVGTEFSVRAYDAQVRVVVAKGEVLLRSQPPLPLTPSPVAFGAGRGNDSLLSPEGRGSPRGLRPLGLSPAPTTTNDTAYLTAGEIAEVTDTGLAIAHHADIAAATTWLQGGLTFDNTPVAEVVREITRTFGVKVAVADSALLQRHVTARFSGQSVTVVLDIVTQTLGARYERVGQGFVIRNGTTGTRAPESGSSPPPLTTARADQAHE